MNRRRSWHNRRRATETSHATRDVFVARNEISHELDLQRPGRRGDRTRRSRGIQPTADHCHEACEVCQLIVNCVVASCRAMSVDNAGTRVPGADHRHFSPSKPLQLDAGVQVPVHRSCGETLPIDRSPLHRSGNDERTERPDLQRRSPGLKLRPRPRTTAAQKGAR